MILKVLSRYSNQVRYFAGGEVVEVDDVEGEMLLRDSPGSFRRIKSRGAANKDDDAPEPGAPPEPEGATGEGAMTTEENAFVPDERKADRRRERKS